jgi:hypothetical protein
VGIIHTNYFVYAQDQPAAFVRVSFIYLFKLYLCQCSKKTKKKEHCHDESIFLTL